MIWMMRKVALQAIALALALQVVVFVTPSAGKLVTFDNTKPRLDSEGAILRAHDGTTQRFGGKGPYYYHAMGYPHCNETGAINGCGKCIYGHNNSLAVYSSPDLSSGSWRLTDAVYTGPGGGTGGWPTCTYFRSQAVYNPTTKLYVLWANVAGCDTSTCPNKTFAAYAMGTSPKPGGPYTFVGMAQPTATSLGPHTGFIGDEALLVDDDGQGYIILTHGIAGAGHRDMYIFRLAPDFLSFDSATSTGPSSDRTRFHPTFPPFLTISRLQTPSGCS
jgi:hypothetical protein